MDGPLYFLVASELTPSPEEEDHIMNGYPDPHEEIDYAMEYDKKDFFLELVRDPGYKENVSLSVGDLLFSYDCVNCLKAVFNGETAGVLELTADAIPLGFFDKQEVPILHKAAHFGAPLITNLFLPGNESQVNLRVDVDHMKGALPLNLVLHRIRRIMGDLRYASSVNVVDDPFEWKSGYALEEVDQIVARMLFLLCTPSLRDELEVVRLLAPKTVGITQEFFKYLKERKLPELAALLMVAREYIMPGGLEERLKIQDFVQKEIAALETSLFRFTYGINNDKLILEAQTKKLEMEAILVLLQIFESIGDKIAAYLRLPYWTSELEQIGEVSLLLKEAGLDAEPVLLAEESRQCSLYDFLHITSPVRKYPIIEKTSNEMNQHTSDKALGEYGKGKSYHKASGKAIADGEQCSMLWLRNKQNLLDKFKLFRDYMSSRSYHTYHPLRATRDLGSTTADKVNDFALKLQLKKQYLGRAGQDCGNSAKITTGCSWGSNLQFNRYCALPPTLSRRIIWTTIIFDRLFACIYPVAFSVVKCLSLYKGCMLPNIASLCKQGQLSQQ